MKVRTSFAKFTSTTLEMLSSNAPTIGLDKDEFYGQVFFFSILSPVCSDIVFKHDTQMLLQIINVTNK